MKLPETLALSAGTVSLFTIGLLGLLFYFGINGVPFIEGDKRYSEGSAFGFTIGSNKSEVLKAIHLGYDKKNYHIRVFWPRNAEYAEQLISYENTYWKSHRTTHFAEYKIAVSELKKIELPLIYSHRWDIEMPAEWVNTIYLTFSNEKLTEIRKSRWLFERP